MQVSNIKFSYQINQKFYSNKENKNNKILNNHSANPLIPRYNDYLLNFGARIDKNAPAFFERNKDKMPASVKKETLAAFEKGENISPLELHKRAYAFLGIEDITLDEIKEIYAEDELFDSIKSPDEIKTLKQGIIRDIQISKDDFKNAGMTIFKNPQKDGTDLTLYLLRKFFLEGKTYEEVNNDLHNDIDEYFHKDNKTYIYPSTLHALGIKLPNRAYLHSLFFTREGMEDIQGEKIRQGHAEAKKRFDELPLEEQQKILEARNARRQEHPLTEEQKAKRNARLSRLATLRWTQMTPEERAEQLLKMMLGRENSDSKYQSYMMILTWNNSLDIRDKMSEYFQNNKTINIDKLILNQEKSGDEINHLKKFWLANPELGKLFSERISNAWAEIKQHIQAGDIDDFTKEILEKQQDIKLQRQKEIAKQQAAEKENILQKKKRLLVEQYLAQHQGYDLFNVVPAYVLNIINHPLASEKVLDNLLHINQKNLQKSEQKEITKQVHKILKDTSEKFFRELSVAQYSMALFYALTSEKPFKSEFLKKGYTEIVAELYKEGINPKKHPIESDLVKNFFELYKNDISDEDAYEIAKKIQKDKGNKTKPLEPKERRIVAQQVKKLGLLSKYIFNEHCDNHTEAELKQGLFLYVFLKTTIPNFPKDLRFNYKPSDKWIDQEHYRA